MSDLHHPRWALAVCATVAMTCAAPALGAPTASVQTNRGCYSVGTPVRLTGTGFAVDRMYVVAIDDVYFGSASTDSSGAFSTSLRPGGLGAGIPQAVEHLDVSDGVRDVTATFTVTRRTGARFLATSGPANALQAPLQAWGFSPTGVRKRLYLHYVAPTGKVVENTAVGRTKGQCGYLRTAPRRLFPFTPAKGRWTLQLDTRKAYSPHPGPVARIHLVIG